MLLGAARCCSVLLGAGLLCFMAIKNVGWVIKFAHAQSSHGIVLFQFLWSTAYASTKFKKCWPKCLDRLTTPN